MKTKSLLPVLFLLFTATLFAQTSGGPDTYGYLWRNQADANGPAYNWIDIKGTGTQITGLGDDNQKGPFNLNWDFHYYWADYNKIWIGSNGWLGFQNIGNIAATFPTIPTPDATNNFLAPLMADLTFTQTNSSPVPGATAWYWTNNTDTLIVQYDSIPYWVQGGSGFSGRYTFQVILSGADSSITYQYKLAQTGTTGYNITEGIRTGIENSTGQIGLQVLNDVFPTANTALKFYYPNPVTYQVFDATPAWNQNTVNGGFFISANGAPVNLTTNIANAGNQTIDTIRANGQILDATFNTVWNSSDTVAMLILGADSTLTYPISYSANTPGTFIYRTSTMLNNDINPANNITDVEMIVVDTTQTSIGLSYSTATSSSTQNGWGGNGGQGIYIEPPFYPVTITSLDYYVMQTGTTGYHLAQILDDDGPNNSAGTVLYLDSIAASATIPDTYNNIPVTKPITILSGGFYVSWLENGDSLSLLGTDQLLPLSNRNYEIIGGSWASFRSNSAEDLMIRANISKYNFGTITTSSTPDGCPSDNSGTATASASAGMSPPYTYMWSAGGQTTNTITGLAAGNYTVTITDSLGVATVVTVPVYNNTVVTAVATTSVTSCYGGSDGAITATIGGTTPYTYLWSNGQITQTATGLAAGVYTVVATNSDGCSNAATDTITDAPMIAATYSVTAETCAGNNGSATAMATGGTGAYSYAWSTTPVQTNATASGLAAGSYTLVITDGNGCTMTSMTSITNVPFLTSISSTPISCFNGCNGTATANATSGGTAPYTYAWSTSPVQMSSVATGLCAGSYTVVITDANGCTSVKSVTLSNPTVLSLNITSIVATSCATCPDGKATASSSGGAGPYMYSWNTTPTQATATATGLLPGTYTVCVTDAKGCTACNTAVIIDGTGINELYSGASIVISPNPFNSSTQVKIDFVNPVHDQLVFRLYDIYGREIQSMDLSEMKGATINFTLNRGYNVPNGMYFYRLEDDKNILSAGKVLVQ